MLKFIFIGWALLVWLSPDSSSVFQDGFEGDAMHISYDRPATPVWSIDSTHHNAALVTSDSFLTDGKVAIPTRFTWDVGTQSLLTYTKFTATISGLIIPKNGLVVLAIYCPKTPYAIPANVLAQVVLDDGSHTISPTAEFVELNNGATAAIAIASNTTGGIFTPTSIHFSIFNENLLTVTTWATSGQTVDIGEIWFGNLVEFKGAPDPQYSLIDPTTNRRSHNNTPWALYQKPYRTFSAGITPISDAVAYSDTVNFDGVRYALATCTACLVIPRLYTRGTTTQDANAINQLSIFGRPESIEPLTGVRDASGLWTARLTVSEAPP